MSERKVQETTHGQPPTAFLNSMIRDEKAVPLDPDKILVPRNKYPKTGEVYLYKCSDTHRHFAIYFYNPCFRVLITGDEYFILKVYDTVAGTIC